MLVRRIIAKDRSIIPACDTGLDLFDRIVRETHSLDAIGAYKIGAALAVQYGLERVVNQARKYTNKPLIYDHQKAGTDIPETGKAFAQTVKNAGIDALILMPLAGPATEIAWINAALACDLPVIVGGHMTHASFLTSEGGYIADEAVGTMFRLAAQQGVTDFVVPGNKPDSIRELRAMLESQGVQPTFYSPGFVAQAGKISAAAKVAGARWHAIVGRALYNAEDIAAAAIALAADI